MLLVNARFLTQKITGVQRFAIEISKQLKKIDSSIKFISSRGIIDCDLAKELEVEQFGRFQSHLWEQIELPIYLKKNGNPLVINFTGLGPVFYRNKFTTIHDVSFLKNPKWFSRKYYYYYKIMTSLNVKFSKKIITVSDFSRREISGYYHLNKDKFIIISNAVSWKKRISSKDEKNKYILTVSSLDPRKNLIRLIRAFNDLDISDYRLIIVGAGNKNFKNEELNNLIQDNIELKGYVTDDELKVLYQEATLFVYPSIYEGFGIPPLEAMTMGCPTVVSNETSLPEVCGDASLYIDPYDINSISGAIMSVIKDKDLQNKIIKKGYDNIVNYNWHVSAEKLYQKIVGEK